MPLDSLPDFYDFHQVAFQRIEDFNSVLPSFSKCAFYDVPGVAGEALSDHLTTWSEFAQCLNSAGTLYSSSNPDVTPHNLWTSGMQPYITRTVVSRELPGGPFSTNVFSYNVVPEHGNEAAILPAATAQRYVNWRNVHYWLYHQLLREEAILNQQSIRTETDDKITTYFKQKNLYPPIDVINSIDHIDAILAESTEKIDSKAPFSLPSRLQQNSWSTKYAEQFPLQGTIWTAESVKDSNASTQTGSIQLAVNKDLMMQGKDAAEAEMKLQQTVQASQQNLSLLKGTEAYQQASSAERAGLEAAFLDGVELFTLLYGASEIVAVVIATDAVRLGCQTGAHGAIESVISRGVFSMEDCGAANETITGYAERIGSHATPLLTDEEITMIVSRQVPRSTTTSGLTNGQYRALAKVYKNKFSGQWYRGVAEIAAALCFHFGTSSNIDCNY